MRRRVLLVAFALAGVGCEAAPSSELLTIDSIGPEVLSEHDALEVRGRDLGSGDALPAELRGEATLPGGARRTITLALPARAVSESALSIPVGDLARVVGGRATFRGEVRVRARGASGIVVEGVRTDVAFDVVAGLHGTALRREHQAERWLDDLGVAVDPDAATDDGLRVASVATESVAERVGLAAGDRLVSLAGLRIRQLSDFVPPRVPSVLVVEIAREGEASAREVVLPMSATAPEGMPPLVWVVLVALLLVVVIFVAPTARFTQWLADAPAMHEEGTLRWLFGARGSSGIGAVVVGGLAMSSAFAGIAVVGRFVAPSVGVSVLMTTALVLRFLARVSSASSGSVLSFLGRGAPIVLCVASVTTLLGTGHLDGVQRAQGPWPWQWLVFANPIAFVLFPAFACAVLAGIDTRDRDGIVAAVSSRAHFLTVSCLGVVLFLGGWSSFGEATDVLDLAAFVAKAWTLLSVGLWLRRVAPELTRNAWRAATATGVLAVLASAAWVAFEPPVLLERAFGFALLGVAAAAIAFVVVARTRRARPYALRLHPFL